MWDVLFFQCCSSNAGTNSIYFIVVNDLFSLVSGFCGCYDTKQQQIGYLVKKKFVVMWIFGYKVIAVLRVSCVTLQNKQIGCLNIYIVFVEWNVINVRAYLFGSVVLVSLSSWIYWYRD